MSRIDERVAARYAAALKKKPATKPDEEVDWEDVNQALIEAEGFMEDMGTHAKNRERKPLVSTTVSCIRKCLDVLEEVGALEAMENRTIRSEVDRLIRPKLKHI